MYIRVKLITTKKEEMIKEDPTDILKARARLQDDVILNREHKSPCLVMLTNHLKSTSVMTYAFSFRNPTRFHDASPRKNRKQI